jgi:lipopolysaccharide biosynthesis glycosyltransferase
MPQSGDMSVVAPLMLSTRMVQGRAMEILCASDNLFLPHTATMIFSLLEHNSVARVHLFYSSIASHELAKLKELVVSCGSTIVLYEVVASELQELRVDKWASIAVYYRLLAPRLLPADLDKILYLDSDTIVRRPLDDLWNTDVSSHALAAAADFVDNEIEPLGLPLGMPAGIKYFNTGVLLINLPFWRQFNVAERAISFARNNPEKIRFWDQDALNATLIDQWIELPAYWNWQDWRHPSMPSIRADPAIVHFISDAKPWRWSCEHPFRHEYHKYRRQTPWRQYQQEGRPSLTQRLGLFLRRFARAVLPQSIRHWLRSRVMNSRV